MTGKLTQLRDPLGRVLLTLSRVKYKDLEIDFGKELKEIEAAAKKIEIQPLPSRKLEPPKPKSAEELLDEADKLAGQFPEAAIAVAWSAIEYALKQLTERCSKDDEPVRASSPLRQISYLRHHGVLHSQELEVLNRMRMLRNEAIHKIPGSLELISSNDATEYVALARGYNGKLSALPAF